MISPPDPSPFASSHQEAAFLPPGLSCGGNREGSSLPGPHRSFQAVPLSYPNSCSSETGLFYTPALQGPPSSPPWTPLPASLWESTFTTEPRLLTQLLPTSPLATTLRDTLRLPDWT